MIRSGSRAALPALLLAAALACGRTPLYGGHADGDAWSETTTSTTTSTTTTATTTSTNTSTSTTGPPPPSCAELGGVPARDGGPWVIAQGLERASVIGLGADDDALLAVWLGPFLGTDPMPDAFGVTVDHDGVVLGTPQVLWERPVISHASMHPAAQGYLLTYCGRESALDVTMSRIVDTTGATIGNELARQPAGFSCGAVAPEGVWTGAAYFFAWTDNSSSEYEVLLDLADVAATTVSSSILVPDGSLYAPPRFAVAPAGVVMAAGIGNTELGIWRIDHAGTVVSDPIVLGAPDGFSIGELVVGLAADGSAWLWVAHRNDEGIRRVVVDTAGNVVVDFEALALPTGSYTDMHAEPWLGGTLITADAWVSPDGITVWFAVDDHGELVAMELVDDGLPALYEANTALAVRGDRAWVLYTAAYEDDTDDVRMYRLACVVG